MIVESQFPDAMAILPSETYVFGQTKGSPTLDQRIICRRLLTNGVEVLAINLGLLAFDFKRSKLGGFRRLDFRGSGYVPQEVSENTDKMISLQLSRLRIATFVAACVYGVHAKRNHTSLDKPLFPTLDDVYRWVEIPERGLFLPEADAKRLESRLGVRRRTLNAGEIASYSIVPENVNEGFELADRLLIATPSYVAADPVSMMVMTFQAMVLHGHQHAGASIALAAVVIEAALEETIFANGFASGISGRLRSTPNVNSIISRNNLEKLGFQGIIKKLNDEGIIDAYLKQRIDSVRLSRNDLMHRSQDASPRQSGEALTTVRDVLWLCTGESGFELNVPWAYRC